MFYEIECEVSGGVTGCRTGMLKGPDGEVAQFETREEAEAKAAQLTADRNGNPYRTTTYRYTVALLAR